MTVKEHYDQHLGQVYSWMAGDFSERTGEFKKFLTDHSIIPNSNKVALDLGAGHGIQSIPLAELGFSVIAVDFNEQLLSELKSYSKGLHILAKNADIRNIKRLADYPELIVCCGDTLSHLDSKQEIELFIANIADSLCMEGKLILSFRDYTEPLTGTNRFIPVKSDENKILTCILDYKTGFVEVTDLLHEKTESGWQQKVSSYRKVRLKTDEIVSMLEGCSLKITFNQIVNRLTTIIAVKE